MDLRRPTLALMLLCAMATGACSAQRAGTPIAAPGTTPVDADTTATASAFRVSTATSIVSTTDAGSTVVTRTVPVTTTASTTPPATTPADTTMPHTTMPHTTMPHTTMPHTTMPHTTMPQTTVPPTTVPPPGTPRTPPTSASRLTDVDAVTQRWVVGMCTDMRGVLEAATAVPDIDGITTFQEYRQALVDYYTALAEASQRALEGARKGLPPRVTRGEQIHRQFVTYLTGLQDIASNGAALLATETTAADVAADAVQLSKEVEKLDTGGAGLGYLSSPELAAALAAAPECAELGG